MKKTLKVWEIVSFLFVCAVGSLLHFVYEWSGGNAVAASLCAVNDSTWEHMKLFFMPYLLFTLIEAFSAVGKAPNYFAAKAVSCLIGLVSIPMLLYTLQGAFGKTPDLVNILIFFVAAAIAAFFSYSFLQSSVLQSKVWQVVGVIVFAVLFLAFVAFTRRPPQLPLFRDPVTFQYGLPKFIR